MNISLEWLNDYIDIGYDAETIAETLSDLGFPCEGIEQVENDTMIDVEVTSNRGDCLGHIGVARELSVATGKPLKLPEVQLNTIDESVSDSVSVQIDEPELCKRYTARVIKGVKVGPTPDWMRRRLETIGLRSVNNVVDATNYALMETGQPPHAFDMAKIGGGKIVVRKANQGETITSIDGSDCKLTPEMLVIADAEIPVAIAGVMGGLNSEVSDQTVDILLEDAFFDPVTVRTSSRRLSLPSDAAYRFERIVDIEKIDWASQRTAQLIVDVAGGQVLQGVVDAYPDKPEPCNVTLRLSRLKKVLGITVPTGDVTRILAALSLEPSLEGDTVHCTVPSWRSDISREVDLIEEVARCYGYAKIETKGRIEIDVTPVDAREKRVQAIGRQVQACGYFEAITVDFVDKTLTELFGAVDASLAVNDASRKEANLLRQTLLGSLLGVLKTNVNAKTLPCRVYEVANTFIAKEGTGLPLEHTKIALVADSDFRQLRTAVECAVAAVVKNAKVEFLPGTCTWAADCASIKVNGVAVGQAGVFSEQVLKRLEIKNVTPVGAELDLDILNGVEGEGLAIQPIPRFPAIERDLSIIVKETVSWNDIVAAVESTQVEMLEDTCFVEIYRGKGVPQGHKSVTLTLRFRDSDGTLTHETVDGYQRSMVDALTKSVGAELRAG